MKKPKPDESAWWVGWVEYACKRTQGDTYTDAVSAYHAGWEAGVKWAQKQAKRALAAEKARKR